MDGGISGFVFNEHIPLEVIAGLTGHTAIKTTREYLHIQPEPAPH